MQRAKRQLVFACDVNSLNDVMNYSSLLLREVGMFKIGPQLWSSRDGLPAVEHLLKMDIPVFLDLKLHDIPSVTAAAAVNIARLGVDMLTIHALGGKAMISEVVEQVHKVCAQEDLSLPSIIAVTVLTSLSDADLRTMGIQGSTADLVSKLANMAIDCGVEGLVCSPVDLRRVIAEVGDEYLLVVPGNRRPLDEQGDQKRTLTPEEAVINGASHVVVGRSIRDSTAAHITAREIVLEMTNALMNRKK